MHLFNGIYFTSWWLHQMEAFSALLAICAWNSPVTVKKPVTRSFDVFFDLRLNKRFRKQSWGWWFETPSHPLWRHRNDDSGFSWYRVQIKWDVAVHGRYLSLETNTRATEEMPALNQSWRGCNHPTSNWPYQGHQGPYRDLRTADYLSPL